MVRLCVAGGGLILQRLQDAAHFHARGDNAIAVAIYREILNKAPDNPDALLMMGLIALQSGNAVLSLKLVEAALAAKPAFASAWFNRGVILRILKRDAEAIESARTATDIAPDLADAWDLIGQILKDQGKYDEAAAAHSSAIALQPGNAHFHGNYAALLQVMGDLPAAYLAAKQASDLDETYPPMVFGNILKAMGYPERAADHFAKSRALRPAFAEAVASEAMARLQMGDLETGWVLWERRPDLEPSLGALPLWQGQKIEHLFLYEDQGLGDAIQFMRYIPFVHNFAASLTLRLHASLHRLCAENFPGIKLIDERDALPAADARCRLSSLPSFFTKNLDDIPAAPYLAANDGLRTVYRSQLEKMAIPRIGLVWAGNKNFHNDKTRSIAFENLQPLLTTGAAHFISLQKERPDDVVKIASSGIFDAVSVINDFADTAALIAELDLVITVDTAVAHLAGALGKAVFILLPFECDWRWLLGREDSPWHKTARLFRQKRPGNWTDVIQSVTGEVKKLIAGDRTVLQPPPWNGACLRQNPHALDLPSADN